MGGMGGTSGEGGMVVDPAPGPGGMGGIGGMGGMGSIDPSTVGKPKAKLRLIDQWFDTSPKETERTADLPLFDPPRFALQAERENGLVRVRLTGGTCDVTTRWEADGEVFGRGTEVSWRPHADTDRIRVAVRSRGGVSIFSMCAAEATKLTPT
jgi:hypothetical protein